MVVVPEPLLVRVEFLVAMTTREHQEAGQPDSKETTLPEIPCLLLYKKARFVARFLGTTPLLATAPDTSPLCDKERGQQGCNNDGDSSSCNGFSGCLWTRLADGTRTTHSRTT